MVSTASSPTMVGRDGELDTLLELERNARSGMPRAVVIGGEAGIGKSRLVREFVSRVEPDAVVCVGECVDLGSVSVPFAPVRGIVRALWDRFGADGIAAAAGPGMSRLLSLLPASVFPDRPVPTGGIRVPRPAERFRARAAGDFRRRQHPRARPGGRALGGSRDPEPHALPASVSPPRSDPCGDHLSQRGPRPPSSPPARARRARSRARRHPPRAAWTGPR